MAQSNSVFRLRTDYLRENGFDIDTLSDYFGKNKKLIYRWLIGNRLPSTSDVIKLAEITKTNVAFLLNLTDISEPNCTYKCNFQLGKIREERDLSAAELSHISGVSQSTIYGYERDDINRIIRIPSLVRLANSLNVSIDYLLGLTNYNKWVDYKTKLDPFYLVEAGDALYIQNEIYAGYCLMSFSKEKLILPNGNSIPMTETIRYGSRVEILKKTMK